MPRSALFLGLALSVLIGLSPATAQPPSDACQPGAQLSYPLAAAIRNEAFPLSFTDGPEMLYDPRHIPDDLPEDQREAMLRRFADLTRQSDQKAAEMRASLAAMEPARRDMLLLAGLDRKLDGTRPLISLATMTRPEFLDLYLAAMDRNGLPAQAAIARQALAAFGSETDPGKRYDMWSDGAGTIRDPALDAHLVTLEAQLAQLRPDILHAAEGLVRSDPGLLAGLQNPDTDVMTMLDWLTARILECGGDWYATVDRQDPFTALPQPQHDLAIMALFMREAMNGSVHQFFANSTGGLAPELAEILQRRGLPEHAAAIRQGMDRLGNPYPRDRGQRHAIMDGFTEGDDDFLYELTEYADDGEIYRSMIAIAIESGLMAELRDAPLH